MVSIGSAIFILTKVILWFTSLERHFITFILGIWFITKIFYMVTVEITLIINPVIWLLNFIEYSF